MNAHAGLLPSPWIRRWAHLLPTGGTVLDVACGSGRHLRWLAGQGFRLTGVDRDSAAVEPLRPLGRIVVADIEGGPWPFAGERFDGVVVTHYLWRDRLADIVGAVAPGGVLLYETFAVGNETVGKPSRPDFLLRPGELLQATQGLEVVAYQNGFLDGPPRFLQRIAAVRPGAVSAGPPRHALDLPADR